MAIPTEIEGRTALEVTSCCVCGVSFGVPRRILDDRRENGGAFYCPNGHTLGWNETEVSRLKTRIAGEQAKREQAEAAARAARENADRDLAARLEAEKKLVRMVRRVGNGVCPCCQRHFINLQRHMLTKHPEAPLRAPRRPGDDDG